MKATVTMDRETRRIQQDLEETIQTRDFEITDHRGHASRMKLKR